MASPDPRTPPVARALAALALAVTVAVSACGRSGAASAPSGEPDPPPVPVATPERRTVAVTLELPGHVEATERVELRSRVPGTIERVAFAEGARVQRGQVLVEIDRRPFEAAVAGAQAAWRQADAEAALARSESERAKRLAERGAMSTEEAVRREAQAAVADARRDAARAALTRARLDLEYTRIRAPLDGRIGRAEVTAGNVIDLDDRLTVLVADATVYVRFDVAESALTGDPSGWHARFTLPEAPDRVFEGPVAFLENEILPGTGTLRARIALPGDPLLLPGRYGDVQLRIGERADALLIEETAIAADQGTRYVLVVDDQGTVQYRPIRTGARIGARRVIEQGLAPDDRVVVAGLMGVRPGMTVAPQDARAVASSAPAGADAGPGGP